MRAHRGRIAMTALLFGTLGLAACGGNSDDDTSPPSSTSSSAATTTTSPAAVADAASEKLAAAALVRASDLGPAWARHSKKKGPIPVEKDDCAARKNGPLSKLAPKAYQLGPSIRVKDENAYVTSWAHAFPSVRQAKQYIAIRKTKAWNECQRQAFERSVKEQNSEQPDTMSVRIDTTTNPAIGTGGLEALTGFVVEYTPEPGDEPQFNAEYYREVYRQGRVVITVGVDYGTWSNPKVGETLSNGVAHGVTQAFRRALAVTNATTTTASP